MNTLKNRAFQVAFFVLLVFFVGYFTIPPARFKLYLDAGRVGIWAVVFFITANLALKSFLAKKRSSGEVVAIALNLTALVILVQAIWIPVNRELDRYISDWIPELVGPLIVLGYMVAGTFFLLPIGNTIGVTPPRNWWFMLFAGVIGALVAGIMIGLGLTS